MYKDKTCLLTHVVELFTGLHPTSTTNDNSCTDLHVQKLSPFILWQLGGNPVASASNGTRISARLKRSQNKGQFVV
jgi:hypothetical protein